MLKELNTILRNEIDPAFAKRARLILEEVEQAHPEKILDAGCGRGFYVHAVSHFPFVKEVQGIDVNEEYLTIAKKYLTDPKITVQKASIYELPFPDKYFDVVISSEVMEHLSDDSAALKEIKRVLKPTGTLLISVPNLHFPFLWDPLNWILMKFFNTHIDKNIWWLAGIWADHERLYTQKDLEKVVQDAGYMIEKTEKVIGHAWPFSHFFLYGIGKNIVERLGVEEFNRFDFREKKLSQLLASILKIPAVLDKSTDSRSVNIFMKLKKS